MTPEAYRNGVPTTHPGNLPVQPPNKSHQRFARALSAVIAVRMQQEGMECVYNLVQAMNEYAEIPVQTVYSCLNHTGRPAHYVVRHIAHALGTTEAKLGDEAELLLASGKPFKTAKEVFRGARKQGRPAGPPRDNSKRWAKKKGEPG